LKILVFPAGKVNKAKNEDIQLESSWGSQGSATFSAVERTYHIRNGVRAIYGASGLKADFPLVRDQYEARPRKDKGKWK